MYLRFAVEEFNPFTESTLGLIGAITNRHEQNAWTDTGDEVEKHLAWLSQHLAKPTSLRCARTGKVGICWFKTSAAHHLEVMHTLTGLAIRQGLSVVILERASLTTVIYEDDIQVVALPEL